MQPLDPITQRLFDEFNQKNEAMQRELYENMWGMARERAFYELESLVQATDPSLSLARRVVRGTGWLVRGTGRLLVRGGQWLISLVEPEKEQDVKPLDGQWRVVHLDSIDPAEDSFTRLPAISPKVRRFNDE